MGSRAQALGDLLGGPDRWPPTGMITRAKQTGEWLLKARIEAESSHQICSNRMAPAGVSRPLLQGVDGQRDILIAKTLTCRAVARQKAELWSATASEILQLQRAPSLISF